MMSSFEASSSFVHGTSRIKSAEETTFFHGFGATEDRVDETWMLDHAGDHVCARAVT